ncbi:hypothetical protein GCM10010294_64540 [Streptomyces griseoloalbus]|nr:hypothetical protein GCM10010294_64540 [Streptomyces griseoloalbus]
MAATMSVSLSASGRSDPASRAHPIRNAAVFSAIGWLAKFDPAVAHASPAASAGSVIPAVISVTAKTSAVSHPGLLMNVPSISAVNIREPEDPTDSDPERRHPAVPSACSSHGGQRFLLAGTLYDSPHALAAGKSPLPDEHAARPVTGTVPAPKKPTGKAKKEQAEVARMHEALFDVALMAGGDDALLTPTVVSWTETLVTALLDSETYQGQLGGLARKPQ